MTYAGDRVEWVLFVIVLLLLSLSGCGQHRDGEGGNGSYTVVIQSVDRSKLILSIKAVREVTGLGLADAKRVVDDVPSVVSEDLSESQARAMAATLESAGMKVEVSGR